mmetsp:Transcript_19298/g.41591  ORF Transcript_19298/g.41591 Transcript_19298/m.41591 type:complete len:145 (-) Transcript_19298:287-721(-)
MPEVISAEFSTPLRRISLSDDNDTKYHHYHHHRGCFFFAAAVIPGQPAGAGSQRASRLVVRHIQKEAKRKRRMRKRENERARARARAALGATGQKTHEAPPSLASSLTHSLLEAIYTCTPLTSAAHSHLHDNSGTSLAWSWKAK